MTSQQRRVAGHACTRQQEERKGDPESHFSSKDTDLPAAWRSAPPGATERVSFLESEKGQRLRAQVEGTLVRKYVGLQHPNLVAVNDVRDDGGGVVAVREDFDGDALPAAGRHATEGAAWVRGGRTSTVIPCRLQAAPRPSCATCCCSSSRS